MSRDPIHPNRIKALPRGDRHWNWSKLPNKLTLHKRLHRSLGKASSLNCVDCGKKAHDWSFQGEEYSDRPEDYKPRCRSCHVKLDMSQERRRKISEGLKRAYAEGRRKGKAAF